MTTRPSVKAGMRVVGSDGGEVGTVKEVRTNDFLIDRPMKRDIYAPFDAIRHVEGDTIMLNISADAVDNTNWPTPPLVSGGGDRDVVGGRDVVRDRDTDRDDLTP